MVPNRPPTPTPNGAPPESAFDVAVAVAVAGVVGAVAVPAAERVEELDAKLPSGDFVVAEEEAGRENPPNGDVEEGFEPKPARANAAPAPPSDPEAVGSTSFPEPKEGGAEVPPPKIGPARGSDFVATATAGDAGDAPALAPALAAGGENFPPLNPPIAVLSDEPFP